MSLTWPDHLLTLEEGEDVPDQPGVRFELAEGVLMISPKPLLGHQRAVQRLTSTIDHHLPPELLALSEVEILVSDPPLTIRVPDVVVIPTAAYGPRLARVAASEVRLAVEVLSDGSRRIDRVLKLAEYAEAGIGQCWIVDIAEPSTLRSHVLVEGAYELSTEASTSSVLDVAGHPIPLDLDGLARR